MQQIETEKVKWIDLEMPNADDMLEISREYHLHPLVMEELATPTLRPKAAQYDGCLYLAIHIPLFDVKEKSTFPAEVDIIITKDTLITSHDKDIFQLTEFFKNLKKTKTYAIPLWAKIPAIFCISFWKRFLNHVFPNWIMLLRNWIILKKKFSPVMKQKWFLKFPLSKETFSTSAAR